MKNLITIANKLSSIWKKTYIVGSYNVHKILHRNFWSDVDLTTQATPDEIRKLLQVVWEIGAKYWTLIVKEWQEIYEITTFRKDIWIINQRKPLEVKFTLNLEEDALRRDFTFNAIYYDILEDKYIDPVGWIADLNAWLIRFVWDINARIDEDALRILRYIRLKNAYELNAADINYKDIISSRIIELNNISKDRIKQELDKVLLMKNNLNALKNLKELWFFRHFLPNIDNLSLAPWGKIIHKEWNTWVHTLMSIQELNKLKTKDVDDYRITLLHDIGKYSSFTYDNLGNIHYYDHELESVAMFEEIVSKDIPFSNDTKKKISWVIKNHIRIGYIDSMKKNKNYHMMLNKYFKNLLILYKVDNLGKNPPDSECGEKLERYYNDFLTKYSKIKFHTWNEIMSKYPNLKWAEIGKKLKEENEILLSKIKLKWS